MTTGVALALFVVPGVPVLLLETVQAFGAPVAALASESRASEMTPSQDPVSHDPVAVVTQQQHSKIDPPVGAADKDTLQSSNMDPWIADLGSESWRDRQRASAALTAAGESARAGLQRALTSEDPEVRAQARSILEVLELRKRLQHPVDGKIPVPGSGRNAQGKVTIEIGGQPVAIDLLPGPFDPISPGGRQDPFEAIRRAEEQMKRMEQQLLRRFPPGRGWTRRTSLDRRLFPGREERGWSTSSQVRITRDGQVILESHSSGSSASIEPLGLTLEELHPSLRAHLPRLIEGGVIVSSVRDRSPAQAAGWKTHDVLTAIDGTPIGSLEDAQNHLLRLHENNDQHIEIVRQGVSRGLAPIKIKETKPKRF